MSRIRQPRDSQRSLGSKVARRTFGLFVICTFVPVTALAWLSMSSVSAKLIEVAEEDLRQESKAAGMKLVEHLTLLEEYLRFLATDLVGAVAPEQREVLSKRRLGWQERFSGLLATSRSGSVLAHYGEIFAPPPEGPREREHLARGHAVVVTTAVGPNTGVLVMTCEDPSGRRLHARVRAKYLFDVEELNPHPTEITVLASSGAVLRGPHGGAALRAALSHARPGDRATGLLRWSRADEEILSAYWTAFTEPAFLSSFVVLRSRARSDVLAALGPFRRIFLNVMGLSLALVVLLGLVQVRRSMNPIRELSIATVRLASGDLGTRVAIDSGDEFETLGASFNSMAADLEQRIETLHHLNQVGISLSRESDEDLLTQVVARSARGVLRLGGCVVYLTQASDRELHLSSLDTDPRQPAVAEALNDDQVQAALLGLAGRAAESDQWQEIDDRDRLPDGRLTISAPMRAHDGQILGVLQLIDQRIAKDLRSLSTDDRRIIESLASQAAVAVNKNRLAQEFRALFDALAELISTAIDEKSPYTGGHCRRVPILTLALAQAVAEAKEGPFAKTALSEQELYELKVAALLHDCGKVSTPVHVVDKATKLETIHDRIELVALRIEILRRDRRIRELEAWSGAAPDARSAVDPAHGCDEHLDRDFELVRRSNIGDEFMADDQRQQIQELARRYLWTDRHDREQPLLTDEEVENLIVRRGTLTEADREMINQHVVSTIRMLEKLPYPKGLEGVPYIAGAHHERIDGKGYPNGLRGEQLNLQARILGLADVFEALTAKDRPYKPGKPLSESLRILGDMAGEGHVDPDLFRLFVNQRIYAAYAAEYLDPAQIDAVDVDSLPGINTAPEADRVA